MVPPNVCCPSSFSAGWFDGRTNDSHYGDSGKTKWNGFWWRAADVIAEKRDTIKMIGRTNILCAVAHTSSGRVEKIWGYVKTEDQGKK